MSCQTTTSSDQEPTIFSSIESLIVDNETEQLFHALQSDLSVIDTYNDRGFTLLHLAAIYGMSDALNVVIKCGANVDIVDFDGGCTALHYAANFGYRECMELLVDAGADLNVQNYDTLSYVNRTIPIYVTGGRTALHMAADAADFETVRYLKDAGIDCEIEDKDGYTALDLAFLSHKKNRQKVIDVLDPNFSIAPLTSEERRKLLKDDHFRRASRISQAVKERNDIFSTSISSQYNPLYPEIFEPEYNMLCNSFSVALGKGNEEGIRSLLVEEGPGIYSFDMLDLDFCKKLSEEVINYEYSGAPIQRPNSMNNYGIILNHIGFHDILDNVIRRFIQPLSNILFPKIGELNHNYSFIVRYKIGQDLDLAKHRDSSHVTLNVCLGLDFEGGNLVFSGESGDEHIEIKHSTGKGILHTGANEHAALPISSGERCNLIIWCKHTSDKFRH